MVHIVMVCQFVSRAKGTRGARGVWRIVGPGQRAIGRGENRVAYSRVRGVVLLQEGAHGAYSDGVSVARRAKGGRAANGGSGPRARRMVD